MGEREILKLDINSLPDFQKELHFTNSTDVKDRVYSRFTYMIEKYSWSIHNKVKMFHTLSQNVGDEVVYTASKKFDVLFKSELHIPLLPIKVRKEYKDIIQICYGHNLGHNIPYQAEVKIDDDHYQGHDSIWLDIHAMFFMKPGTGMRDHYNLMIGNIPCLEEWAVELPGLVLTPPQPFSYARNTRTGIKMLQSSMNTITHHYKIRNKIPEILRMREKTTDGWKEIPCNMDYLLTPKNTDRLPIPELWGRYGLMTDEEREWFKLDVVNKPNICYIEDILSFKSDVCSYGSKETIQIRDKAPCKALFWVAQNVTALKNRNFSNYTTNSDNLFNGWNPCSKVDIKYGETHRAKKLSREHFDQSEAWDFFPSAPSEPAYNAYALGYDFNSIRNTDTGIILDLIHGSLCIRLADTNPFKSLDILSDSPSEDCDEKNESENQEFIIHVRALVCKKMEMIWNDPKLTYKITPK